MSFAQVALHVREAPAIVVESVDPGGPEASPNPSSAAEPPPEFQKLVAQLEAIESGIEADRRLRCEAMNRLTSLERILHRLEALSRVVPTPTKDAEPIELDATLVANAGASTTVIAPKAAPAVWEATFVVREHDAHAAEGNVALAVVEGHPHLVRWMDYLVSRVGTEWVPRLLEHYHRVGWIHADQHAWLADLARQLPQAAPEQVSLETLREVHDETRRILGIAPVASE